MLSSIRNTKFIKISKLNMFIYEGPRAKQTYPRAFSPILVLLGEPTNHIELLDL